MSNPDFDAFGSTPIQLNDIQLDLPTLASTPPQPPMDKIKTFPQELSDIQKGIQSSLPNKCYLHSTLQMLLHNKRFCYSVLTSNELTNNVITGFKTLINKYYLTTEPITDADYQFLIIPDTMTASDSQQDAYEFIQELYLQISDIFNKIYAFDNQVTTFHANIEKDDTPINEVFTPVLKLELYENNPTLLEMYKNYYKFEILDLSETNKFSMIKYNTFPTKFNKSLLIHINRATGTKKNDIDVEIPETFLNYTLTGFIFHQGENIRSGHYKYYGKDANNEWYEYNENTITKVDILLILPKAYILCYARMNMFEDGGVKQIKIDQTNYTDEILNVPGSVACVDDKIFVISKNKDKVINDIGEEVQRPDKLTKCVNVTFENLAEPLQKYINNILAEKQVEENKKKESQIDEFVVAPTNTEVFDKNDIPISKEEIIKDFIKEIINTDTKENIVSLAVYTGMSKEQVEKIYDDVLKEILTDFDKTTNNYIKLLMLNPNIESSEFMDKIKESGFYEDVNTLVTDEHIQEIIVSRLQKYEYEYKKNKNKTQRNIQKLIKNKKGGYKTLKKRK